MIIEHDDGALQALCRTKNSCIAETWSFDSGNSWSGLKCTALINPNAAIDAIKYDDFGFILVYNNCKHGRYRLEVATSMDGRAWEDKHIIEESMGEYSYPSIEVGKSGASCVVFL